MNIDYEKELNPSQYEAVTYDEGPSLIIAGAGSGKTRVLTYKIAYLLENGYKPWNILALTFTNKAAKEMKERIARQIGEAHVRRLWAGTFHSIFSRILRAESHYIGFPSHFTIYDAADSKGLVYDIIKELKLDDKIYKPGIVQARISQAKNQLITPLQYAASKEIYENDLACRMPLLRDIYFRYLERCRLAGAMDFDDLLLYTYILFKEHPEVLSNYIAQFRYVLVDEYQDTNFAQHSIIQQLAKEHGNICVVGDDAQSIYSFRGANIDNILSFTQTFPQTRLFKLEQNYRSTQTIVSAANSLIKKNEHQIPKEAYSKKEKGDPIEVFHAYSDVEEGEIVTRKIMELHQREKSPYDDFAILYRTNTQSRIFEESLRKHGIPYKIYGGVSFYQRKEIKDVIAYFRLVVNKNDEEALKRVINYPTRGIGTTTLTKLSAAAVRFNVSLWTVLCDPKQYELDIKKNTQTKLSDFRNLIENLSDGASELSAHQIGINVVQKSGIAADISIDNTPENLARKENVEELLNAISDFCDMRKEEGNDNVLLSDFLTEVALLTNEDTTDNEDEKKVALMTIHSAKGLEFRNVFIVGMEESLFPSMKDDSPPALEEERRLLYVAITRAEKRCYLSYAKTRFRYGKMEFESPSRFFKDIDKDYLLVPKETSFQPFGTSSKRLQREIEGGFTRPASSANNFISATQSLNRPGRLRPIASSASSSPRTSSSNASYLGIKIGQRIAHERFGIGEVLKLEDSGDNAKATIQFQNAGIKQLLLRYARFKILE